MQTLLSTFTFPARAADAASLLVKHAAQSLVLPPLVPASVLSSISHQLLNVFVFVIMLLLVTSITVATVRLMQRRRLHIREQPQPYARSSRGQSSVYVQTLYLLLSFPLGLIYFTFFVLGISLGLGTLVIWIGAFVLFFMHVCWWNVAAFERHMAMRWLHISIAPMTQPQPTGLTRWQRVQAQVRDPMQWKTLLYVLLKFPLGVIFFIFSLASLSLILVGTIAGSVIGFVTAPFVVLVQLWRGDEHAGQRFRAFLRLALMGFGVGLLGVSLLRYMAEIAAQFARLMLGISDAAVQLEGVQKTVVQERARAEQAEQRRHELVINVSHELRTPVASIAGHLESLLLATADGTTSPPPAVLYQYLRIAHQEVGRLGLLVDELLSLARMQTDELQLDIQAISARDAIEEVYHLLSPLAQRGRQVTLVRGTAANLPAVQADYQRLVQILLNLVRNAINSTPAGGIVSISLEPADEQHLALIVADNGVGISSEDLEHIFERFYRTDTSRTRKTGGFGLGLAIVHDLVVAMGGTISVESTVGAGSCFSVLLRIA